MLILSSTIKYHLAGLLLASVALFLPFGAHAAFDDVTLTTDTQITAGGVTVSVSGSSASLSSIVVNSDDFLVTLEANSTITVSSSNRNVLAVDKEAFLTDNVCSDTESKITLTSSVLTTVVTVTPSSDTCGSSAITSTGTDTGSGGSSYKRRAPTAPVVQVNTSEPEIIPTTTQGSAAFTTTLRRGVQSDDVRRLQVFLASDPTLYPEGITSGFFGSLTEKAVQRFQEKYGVVSSGTPGTTGYGLVGPATRAKLLAVFGAAQIPTVPTTEAPVITPSSSLTPTKQITITRSLSQGTTHAEVKLLQQLLNNDPETEVASSGEGSAGNETTYFGRLTTEAVQKFQTKHGVVVPGDSGYGFVGPKTRAKLIELFGNTATTPTSDEAALKQQLNDLQNMVDSLMKQLETLQ